MSYKPIILLTFHYGSTLKILKIKCSDHNPCEFLSHSFFLEGYFLLISFCIWKHIILCYLASVWEVRFARFLAEAFFSVSPMHCSRDSQVPYSATFSLKLSPTALFIHLKIILLQCFQFSAISGIQTNP